MRQIDPAATRFFNNAGRPRNSEAGLTVHDLSAPCTMPPAERRRFFRSRPCLAAVRLTAAVLVLAAASLVFVRPAFAEGFTVEAAAALLIVRRGAAPPDSVAAGLNVWSTAA